MRTSIFVHQYQNQEFYIVGSRKAKLQIRLIENYSPAKFDAYAGLPGYFVPFCLKTRK